jgi:biopolymer transport protein ExbB/TolQ
MALTTPLTTSRSVPLLPCCVYGAGFAFLLFGLMRQGWVSHPLLDRYVLGHPVSLIETLMFCVGATALLLKAIQLGKERSQLSRWLPPSLEEASPPAPPMESLSSDTAAESAAREPVATTAVRRAKPQPDSTNLQSEAALASRYLEAMDRQPPPDRDGSLNQRIREALRFVHSRQSSAGLDDQLKHLANQEADAQHESYALIRLMVWAIPMLGFLGTVLGISEALGGLNLGADADLSALIGNLKSSLYIAFDTTALALTYGIGLMFIQFGLDRYEKTSLQRVDELTDEFMFRNFSSEEISVDSPSQAISRMGQALLKATFSLVEHQHDLWSESLSAAQEAWIAATENSATQSEGLLRTTMSAAGSQMAETLREALGTAELQLQHRAQQWQVSMSDSTRVLAKFQENAATHIQLLEQFFQQNSHLSHQQQASIDQLVSRLDQLINQNYQTHAHWQTELARITDLERTRQTDVETLTASQATQEAQIARERSQTEARLAAEISARAAAEDRARAEAEARLAAEGLATAESAARRIAEQHVQAALEAKQRAEELAQAAINARKLAERQITLEAENRQLAANNLALNDELRQAQQVASQVPLTWPDAPPVAVFGPVPGATMAPQSMSGPTATAADVSIPEIALTATSDSAALPPVHGQSPAMTPAQPHAATAGPWQHHAPEIAHDPAAETISDIISATTAEPAATAAEQVINRHVQSSLLPFPDAKIYRAA